MEENIGHIIGMYEGDKKVLADLHTFYLSLRSINDFETNEEEENTVNFLRMIISELLFSDEIIVENIRIEQERVAIESLREKDESDEYEPREGLRLYFTAIINNLELLLKELRTNAIETE